MLENLLNNPVASDKNSSMIVGGSSPFHGCGSGPIWHNYGLLLNAENTAPYTFSLSFCVAVPASVNIAEHHNSLCHPGIIRMLHFLRTRNLLFSVEEVR